MKYYLDFQQTFIISSIVVFLFFLCTAVAWCRLAASTLTTMNHAYDMTSGSRYRLLEFCAQRGSFWTHFCRALHVSKLWNSETVGTSTIDCGRLL